MKKFLIAVFILAGSLAVKAQGISFGIKAGANFSKLSGDFDSDNRTSFHAGAALELNFVPSFSLQAEGLFSSQGGKYDNAFDAADDFNLDYISVPVMAKYYVLPETLSIMAGPQFSFLVNEADSAWDTKSFDMAAVGGVELKIIGGLFAQARYVAGLSNISDEGDVKNNVIQLSVGYYF
ncbi:porin family protein [Flavobacterium rhizosphaerae]|uniref:Porin family protein n=1 Tax=Flavobacterium rhizosphaerae TaxID=3163298 RepID=A0ABW8YWK5_9FLAO